MKNIVTTLGILLFTCLNAQTSNLTYTASSAVISNPERGFYKHSTSNSAIDEANLVDYRLNNNITLLYREIRLDAFVNAPISQDFLNKMQIDFNKIRNAGLKCILRFVYSNSENALPRDATKSLMLSHILQLKPVLQANGDIISVMQAGFIGVWGEWYYTSQADFGGNGYNLTPLTAFNYSNRKEILDAILDALPANRTVQIRYPSMKQKLFSLTALSSGQAFDETNVSRVGHHNDCFLASPTDYGTYQNTTVEFPYLAQETKYLAMGGETCKLNSPRSDCSTALLEMEKFHWSFLNLDYYPPVIDGFEVDNCFSEIQKKLGYRIQLNSASLPQAVSLGAPLNVTLKIKNTGYSAPYNERNAYIVLKNLTTNQVYPILMATDPRTWLGPDELTITESLSLPSNLTTGNYKMYLSLPDSAASLADRPEYAIRLANENVWESVTGYNNLNHTINITGGALGVADNSKFDMTIYPIPSNSEVNVALNRINDYKVAFYNSIGQNVNVPNTSEGNKMVVNTSNLSEGLYYIEFTKGTVKDTRKIMVKH